MSRIQQISLQAIAFKQLLSPKKSLQVKEIPSRLAISKPIPRITGMMTKKNTSSNLSSAQVSVQKKNPYALPETSRSNSSTISAPYAGATKTRITVKYDVGFGNTLYIRGHGAHLNWEKGSAMRNTKTDEWIWETETHFSTAEFKILINDKAYEIGRNHLLHCGTMVQYTPKF